MMIENRTKRGLLTFLIAACSFMNTFMSNSVNLAIPSMAAEFNMSATDSSWIVSMFLLALAALCIPFGRISDLTSRRVIFLAGIACFTVTTFGTLLAWSAASLLAFRLLSGVSAAMIFSSNTPIILDAFPREQGGRALGYLVTGVYLGLATGPVIGGLLTHAFGWRSIFIIATISEAIFFIGGLAVIPNTKKDTTHARRFSIARFDPAGSLVLTAAIVCLMVGFSTFTQSLISKLLIIAAIALFAVFAVLELRVKSPVVNLRLFRSNKNYTFSNFAALLNYAATFGLTYLMSTYLQTVKGFDAGIAGIILICQPVVMAIVSPPMGRLSDKHSPYLFATVGMFICAASIALFCFVGVDTPLIVIIAGLLLMGLGVGIFSTPNNRAVMMNVEAKDNGVASSVLNTMRSVGQSSSLAIITLVSALNLGQQTFANATPDAFVAAIRVCFIVFLVLSVCAIVLSLQRKAK